MKKQLLLLILFFTLFSSALLSAQDYENVFNIFLLKFVERNSELKTLPMPNVEIYTVPEMPGEALYMLDFKTQKDW